MLDELLNSFEVDGDGWLYYGEVDPKQAAAELDALREALIGARSQLRSAQINWQEQCYFECDAILTKAIGDEK